MPTLQGDKIIAVDKVLGYLLNPDHPTGKGKERFFSRFGFSRETSSVLIEALRRHAEEREVVSTEDSVFGRKTVVACALSSPDGRNPCIRAIWVEEPATGTHRFVTAYPESPQ